MAYTDIFNVGLDELVTKLGTATGLRVVNDPRNISPPCIYVDGPDIEAFSNKAAKMIFPVRVISLGPANLDAGRNLLEMIDKILLAGVGLLDARPSGVTIGGVEYAAYDLRINLEVYKP